MLGRTLCGLPCRSKHKKKRDNMQDSLKEYERRSQGEVEKKGQARERWRWSKLMTRSGENDPCLIRSAERCIDRDDKRVMWGRQRMETHQ